MVQGYCIFGGWMIAAAMDVLFAADDAPFIPVYGAYFTAHWDVGARKAKEILYENRYMTAQETLLSAFVNRLGVVVQDGEDRAHLHRDGRPAGGTPRRSGAG